MNELWFYIPFNSISAISGRWKDEHERLCAMKRRFVWERISPRVGFEPATVDRSREHVLKSCLKLSIFRHGVALAYSLAYRLYQNQ